MDSVYAKMNRPFHNCVTIRMDIGNQNGGYLSQVKYALIDLDRAV